LRKHSKEAEEEESDSIAIEKTQRKYWKQHTRVLETAWQMNYYRQSNLVPQMYFEKIVIEILVKMGYGGSRQDAGRAIGKNGDEGIDGIIKEDRLGLDIIYIQAKRWENTVGRTEIQRFAGALQGQRARKGIFITTSNFSSEAQEYASRIESEIVLIDGEHLSQLMIDHNLGVSPMALYEVKN
jgi:restriction system protein